MPGIVFHTLWIVFAALWVAPNLYAQLLSPQEFLGYALGEDFTPHHRVTAYFEHVASEVAHVTLEQYGATTEGRPLLYAIVSSATNMGRLEIIRKGNLQRARLLPGTPESEGPALVWLSYNVHGNESVSTEAALATLYALADSTDMRSQAWLEDVVVILDPCINPDGRERYVQFYRSTRGQTFDPLPEAREHAEPWPGGRTNHYYFDLNRDWAWGTQSETRQRLVHYNRWMPHVHVDFHEQGVNEPYYFAPAAEPYHVYITPWQHEFQRLIGKNHARYFDTNGWLFFTRQVFDLFYPGYGDTWPMFNGAVGMTYEQGGSGRAGLGIITAEGDTLTLRDRIDHHFTTSLSTIEVVARNRIQITHEFADYFARASASPTGTHAAYVIPWADQVDQVSTLQRHLDLLGIRYATATQQTHTSGFAYRTGATGPVTVSQGDMVVPAAQPKGVLTSVLFEPEAELRDSLSYDITAWTLPYVYGIEAYAVDTAIDINTPAYNPPVADEPDEAHRPAAYLAEWKSFEDAQLLARLLHHGVKVRFSERPFTAAGKSYGAGTLIMTRGGAGKEFDEAVRAASRAVGQPVDAVESTMVTEGVDFGSSDVPYLRRPRVAVIAGPAVSAYSLGELWHFFDEQLQYPATLIGSDTFAHLHLYRYDVVILPSGNYGEVLTESRLGEIREWIRAGGRLIAIEGAARFLAGKEGFSLTKFEKKDEDKKEKEPESLLKRYADRDRTAISEEVSGAIFRASLDVTHPLAFGYNEVYFTLKRANEAHTWLAEGWNVGVVHKNSLVSGFAGSKAEVAQENSLLFGTESLGRGEVIYLLDSPIFRGFWYGGRLLLANAVFLVGQRIVASF